MILGIFTALAFFLSAAKFVTKRLPYKKLDKVFLKIHKFSGTAFVLLAVVHGVLAWQLRFQRPAAMTVLGLVMLVCAVVEVLSHAFSHKLGKKWLWLHSGASAVLLICLVFHIIFGVTSLNAYQQQIAALPQMQPTFDFKETADGTYEGSCDVGYIFAKVRVTVKDGKAQEIKILEHRNEHGKPAEKITAEMLKNQTVNTDAVTGATNSSKVLKAAVADALSHGKK